MAEETFQRAGRPRIYDQLEIVALFTEGANRGQTVDRTATSIAMMMADRAHLKPGRDRDRQIRQESARLARYYHKYRLGLQRCLYPAEGKGVLEKDKTAQGLIFGPFSFNGRILQLPEAMRPRCPIRPGRPKKAG